MRRQILKTATIIVHDLVATALAVLLTFAIRFDGPLLPERLAHLPVLLPQVQSGRLRALGVASAERSALMRDVPTLREHGQALEAFNWYGIIVAAKTPPETVARLREGLHKALNDAELKEKLISRGADPIPGSTEQFASFLRDEIAKWGRIVKASGARAD